MFTVGVYRAGNDGEGFAWVVRDDSDELVSDGREPEWTDALSQAVLAMCGKLGREYGAPPMRVHGLEPD